MSQIERVVLDTNVVVSGILFPGSVPSVAILKAQSGVVLASEAMLLELDEVLKRSRFDRYASSEKRGLAFVQFSQAVIQVAVPAPIHVCRDPRDDKFLDAAIHGKAEAIITGDSDLLALDPFHGVRIVTPVAFLNL